jgi:hypothetical protein
MSELHTPILDKPFSGVQPEGVDDPLLVPTIRGEVGPEEMATRALAWVAEWVTSTANDESAYWNFHRPIEFNRTTDLHRAAELDFRKRLPDTISQSSTDGPIHPVLLENAHAVLNDIDPRGIDYKKLDKSIAKARDTKSTLKRVVAQVGPILVTKLTGCHIDNDTIVPLHTRYLFERKW